MKLSVFSMNNRLCPFSLNIRRFLKLSMWFFELHCKPCYIYPVYVFVLLFRMNIFVFVNYYRWRLHSTAYVLYFNYIYNQGANMLREMFKTFKWFIFMTFVIVIRSTILSSKVTLLSAHLKFFNEFLWLIHNMISLFLCLLLRSWNQLFIRRIVYFW